MSNERVYVVDENDNVLLIKNRSDLTINDRWRITAVWLVNSNGEVLIAKRHHSKKLHPNLWGTSAAGTVEEGETPEINAVKELSEELGVKDIDLIPIAQGSINGNDGTKRYYYCYVGKCDLTAEDFVLQDDEVSEVKWIDPSKLLVDREQNPENYVPSSMHWRMMFNTIFAD